MTSRPESPLALTKRFRLAGRGLRYRVLRATGRATRPQALSLEVTRRCVARCVMCNIWKTPADLPELTAPEWLRVLGGPGLTDLRELDVTGGEPFLRDDLAELMAGVSRMKRDRFPRLGSVAITTNGFLTERVLAAVDRFLPALEEAEIGLVFALGFDAVGELHDRIRRFEGGWERLERTLMGLLERQERHPALVLGLKTTVTRHNADELDRVARYAEERGLFTIVSPYIITPTRYGNEDLDEALSLSPEQQEELRRFYAGRPSRWPGLVSERSARRKPCTAGFNYYFIRSDGELYPCPLIQAPLGNVRRAPLETLGRRPGARAFRRAVGRHTQCATCTEPGLERYALPFEGWRYLKLGLRLGPREFGSLHRHLGLEKYL